MAVLTLKRQNAKAFMSVPSCLAAFIPSLLANKVKPVQRVARLGTNRRTRPCLGE